MPRHAFVPGVTLAHAYNPDLAVITKCDSGGTALSCASVPRLVAGMLEQLDVRGGHRVFEAGAGTGWWISDDGYAIRYAKFQNINHARDDRHI